MKSIFNCCPSLSRVGCYINRSGLTRCKQTNWIVLLATTIVLTHSTLNFAMDKKNDAVGIERWQAESGNHSSASPINYSSALARIDKELRSNVNFAATRTDSWLPLERVANSYLARARLTGSIEDYLAAQSNLQQAFSLAGNGGPVLARAALNYSMHKIPAVKADLNTAKSALLISPATQSHIAGIGADVLFQTGDYVEAKKAYFHLESVNPDMRNAARLAHYYQHVGAYKQAEQWFAKAEHRIMGRAAHQRSWLKLQLGILDLERGRYDDALAHYNEALAVFPGFWLVQEHIAEIDAIQGRNAKAEAMYRTLIPGTGSPLFMAALADVLDAQGSTAQKTESDGWRKKANNAYTKMIAQTPEIVSGHAIEYFLQTDNSPRTLMLAQENYRLRPNGQAALLLVQAHVVRKQNNQALLLLEQVLSSQYRSAELHATASVILRASGDSQRADQQEARALMINPDAMNNIDWLQEALMNNSLVKN